MLDTCQDEATRAQTGGTRNPRARRFRVSARHGTKRSEPPFSRRTLPEESEMSTIHRFRPAVFVVAVCTFAISAPIAVNADDQVIVDEQIIAALEQVPALAPAVPSWDESSGYGSVEASRAANALPEAPAASMSSQDYPVVLDRGTRAESAILWTILHREEE